MVFSKIFKKNEEIKNDYDPKDVKTLTQSLQKAGYGVVTDEAREASLETRRRKANLKQLEMQMQEKRLLRDMSREDFEWQLDQEERMERLKSMKIDNLKGTEGDSSADMMFMHLLDKISSNQAPYAPNMAQPQEVPTQNIQMPGEEEKWLPQTRFSDDQMKDLIDKLPKQVIQAFKNLEEDEVLQAYDLIKTM